MYLTGSMPWGVEGKWQDGYLCSIKDREGRDGMQEYKESIVV